MRTDFQLGDIRVRPRRDCIEADGRIAHVTPKAMAVLERLARSAGEVVTRDWEHIIGGPGSAVTNGVHMPTWIGGAMGRRIAEAKRKLPG